MIGKLIKEETFDPDKAAEAQIRFCDENEYPVFCPTSKASDYACYRCRKNIFERGGYSVERASNELITGCRFCCFSFVE